MQLTGEQVKRSMRFYRLSVRDVAARMDITQVRVREVMARGVTGEAYVWDWLAALMNYRIERRDLRMYLDCV